jgi:hypothetical protein
MEAFDADLWWYYFEHYGIDLNHYPSQGKRYRLIVKIEAFEAYGGCRCDWCGLSDPVMLTLDHIRQDGAERHRQGDPRGGTVLYQWLKQQGYPPGFRVLCFNHNILAAWLARRGIYQNELERARGTDPPPTRARIVAYVREQVEAGRSRSEVARELNISEATLRNWMEATNGIEVTH